MLRDHVERLAQLAPEILAAAPHVAGIPVIFDVSAMSVSFLLTIVLVMGIRESAGLNVLIVLLKLAVVLFVISARQGDCSQSERLCLMPLEDDDPTPRPSAPPAPPGDEST